MFFLLMYLPCLVLIAISFIRDKHVVLNAILSSQTWSLRRATLLVALFLTGIMFKLLWYYVPGLNAFPYNAKTSTMYGLCFMLVISLLFLGIMRNHLLAIAGSFIIVKDKIGDVLLCCFVFTILHIVNLFVLKLDIVSQNQLIFINEARSFPKILLVLYLIQHIIAVPILEETIFRCLIYTPLFRKIGKLAIVMSSVLWAYTHFGSVQSVIALSISGLLMALLYARSGSVVHSSIFHMFLNSWILLYFIKGN